MALVTAVQIAMTNTGIEKLIDSLVLGNTISISKFRLSKNGDDTYYNALRDFRTVYEVDGVISGVDTSSPHPLLYYMPFTADEFSSKNGEPVVIPPGTPDTNNIINLTYTSYNIRWKGVCKIKNLFIVCTKCYSNVSCIFYKS